MYFFTFVFLTLLISFEGVMCQFNMTEYRTMPPLHKIDDYDKCLDTQTPSSYCGVIGEIVPNDNSSLWNRIANFSADYKRNFRHDYQFYGVCIETCKDIVDSLSAVERDQLYKGEITNSELVEYVTHINHRKSDARDLYHKLINTCLNKDFKKKYKLETRSFIAYCETNDPAPKFAFLEIVFMLLVGTLLFLAFMSTNYDRQLKIKQPSAMQGNEFYQKPLQTKFDSLLTSFSIYRNYYRLSKPSNRPLTSDFRFFETYKFFSAVLVIAAHVFLLLKSIPMLNTEFIEKSFHRLHINALINGIIIIQVFFVLSSFLLCFNFQKTMASKKPGLGYWGHTIFTRYLRIAPSLGFVLLLNASILPRLQDGPVWRFAVGSENVLCRETWWSNLLFINNFMLKKTCMPQTWYLAADFQLYVLMSGLLFLIARFPKSINYVLGGGLVVSILTAGLATYFLGLSGSHQETLESYRYLFWSDETVTFYYGYIPFYMNMGGYFCGAITALIYIKYKDEGLDLKGRKAKFNFFLYLSFLFAGSLFFTGLIFTYYEFVKPSIWAAIYAALHRNIFAVMCCCMILMMCFKVGGLAYKFSSHKLFVPLGRLSFQAYLIHPIIIRCVGGCIRQPMYINYFIFTMYCVVSVSLSFVFAIFLYMLVETPVSVITNTLLKKRDNSSKDVNTKELNDKKKIETIEPTTNA